MHIAERNTDLKGAILMRTHQEAVKKWRNELERLWKEQQKEVVMAIGEEQTRGFQQSLDSLNNALIHEQDDVDDHASNAYDSWVELTSEREQRAKRSTAGMHTLPRLPYAYDALEPYIDEKTMRIHHDKHHLSYVEGLNKAEKEMEKARKTNAYELLKHWEREAAFHGAGHYLHTLFWFTMKPNGGGKPKGSLAQQIAVDFGSFDQMKTHFSKAAEQVEGGGWAMLVWAPRAHKLEILQAEKHQNLSQQDQIPLLAIDVWEHAYYLKHQNEKKKYIEAWWNVVNWSEVEKRFNEAMKIKWDKY